jgi:neutral ceramidase
VPEPAPYLAGAAQVDITPDLGTHLSGDIARHRPALSQLDPLFARATVFEAGGRRVCFLSLDVTIVCEEYTSRIRQEAARRFGLEPEAVMVHATQTHSAPSLGRIMLDRDFPPLPAELEWVGGGEQAWGDRAAAGAVEAIGAACEALRPVSLGSASAIEGRLAFNRRAVMRDGQVMMPGPSWAGGEAGPTWIRYIEGPMDPEVGVLAARGAAGGLDAVLVHHTCHPVHVFPKPEVSADWPGALCDEIQRLAGGQTVASVVNGACGNINPWPPFDPDYVEDHVRMGGLLAKAARAALEGMSFEEAGVVDWGLRQVPLPLREVKAAELEWALGILGEAPCPVWDEAHTGVDYDWMVAASIYSVELMRRRGTTFAYEVQVLRVGDTALVGLPGEPFVEGQLAIKLASPARQTYVAHCTTQYVGYIPTREALTRGGHEVDTRYWAKLTPQALDQVVLAATELLQDVFGR